MVLVLIWLELIELTLCCRLMTSSGCLDLDGSFSSFLCWLVQRCKQSQRCSYLLEAILFLVCFPCSWMAMMRVWSSLMLQGSTLQYTPSASKTQKGDKILYCSSWECGKCFFDAKNLSWSDKYSCSSSPTRIRRPNSVVVTVVDIGTGETDSNRRRSISGLYYPMFK